MRIVYWISMGLVLIGLGCSEVPQQKTMTIVNAAAVDAESLESIRQFVESQLHIPVQTLEKPRLAGKKSFQALEKAAQRARHSADIIYVVLAGFSSESQHLAVYPEERIGLVNAQALYTPEEKAFTRRIERQVMRAAAFSLGLPPTPDPFCVTRDYKSVEELDRMGRNFSPPWQARFAEEAKKAGLPPLELGGSKAIPGT